MNITVMNAYISDMQDIIADYTQLVNQFERYAKEKKLIDENHCIEILQYDWFINKNTGGYVNFSWDDFANWVEKDTNRSIKDYQN